MTNNSHLCVIYIKAEPEKIWEALTTANFTRQYFHHTNVESDWQKGSDVTFYNQDGSIAIKGEVLVSSFPSNLSISWHVHYDETAKKEPPSRVSFTLEKVEETTKLTVFHDQFIENSVVLPNITEGWIAILSNLKTLVETGKTLTIS